MSDKSGCRSSMHIKPACGSKTPGIDRQAVSMTSPAWGMSRSGMAWAYRCVSFIHAFATAETGLPGIYRR